MDFKNSFAWLKAVKKLIFDYDKFFGSGHVSIFFSDLMDRNMVQAENFLLKSKISFFTTVTPVLFFYNFWTQLLMAATLPILRMS